MRVRSVLSAFAAGILGAGLLAAPASAGTGPSQWCSDSFYWQRVVVETPVTIGIEITYPPGTQHNQIVICYSTSATTTQNSIIGGNIVVDTWLDTFSATPGAYARIDCNGDSYVSVGPVTCSAANSANVAINDVVPSIVPNAACLVSVGAGCAVYLPGVKVYPNSTGAPLLALQVANVPVPVDAPVQCVALFTSCP